MTQPQSPMSSQPMTPWMTPQGTGNQLDPLTHLLNLLTGFAFQSGLSGQGGLNPDGSPSDGSSRYGGGKGSNGNGGNGVSGLGSVGSGGSGGVGGLGFG